jgi:thioredoxin reductase
MKCLRCHNDRTVKNVLKYATWSAGAWHCPHCDGLESAGKSLIILANGKVGSSDGAISYAKEFLGWTNNIRVFLQDNCPIDQEQRNEAKRLSIEIIENDPLVEVLKVSDRSSGKIKLLSNSGKVYYSDVVFYHLGYKVQNSLAKQLGCELEEEFIKVDKRQQTIVPQVFAAGDIDTDSIRSICYSKWSVGSYLNLWRYFKEGTGNLNHIYGTTLAARCIWANLW